jgi:aspartate aminotransferase
LNLNVRGMPRSATVTINERLAAMRAEGTKVFRLGLGQSPFPVPEPVIEALRRSAHVKDYLAVCGLRELRESIVAHLWRQQSVERKPNHVLIGPGSKELMFLLQLVYYGDLVIPTPSWVSYAPQARIIGRRVVSLPTTAENKWRITPEDLEALCQEDPGRPRILILNYPSNPTGLTYSLDRLRELASVARRHRIVVLSDEIYGDLHHRGQHVSIARFYPEGTIVSNGISKWCGAGGWRLGAFVFPPGMRWLLEAMAAAASETYTSTSAPIQHAAITAFEGGPWMDAYLRRSRRVLFAIGREVSSLLANAGVPCERPTGGFYIFPNFSVLRDRLAERGIRTSRHLCERILEETGVGILPGTDFGRPPEELTARVAYVDFDGGRALDAAAGASDASPLGRGFVREHAPEVLTAIERIVEWVARRAAAGVRA